MMTGTLPETSTLSVYRLYLLPSNSAAFSRSRSSGGFSSSCASLHPSPVPTVTQTVERDSPRSTAVSYSSTSVASAVRRERIASIFWSMYA